MGLAEEFHRLIKSQAGRPLTPDEESQTIVISAEFKVFVAENLNSLAGVLYGKQKPLRPANNQAITDGPPPDEVD